MKYGDKLELEPKDYCGLVCIASKVVLLVPSEDSNAALATFSNNDRKDNRVLFITQQFQTTPYYDLNEHVVSVQGCTSGTQELGLSPMFALFQKRYAPSTVRALHLLRIHTQNESTLHEQARLVKLASCGSFPKF